LDLIGAALKMKAKDAGALLHYGVVLAGLKRHGEALAAYDRALAIAPGNLEAIYYRAVALQALDRLEEALAGCDKAVAVEPDHIEAPTNRGNSCAA
jgi:tetratricopeptide (TPR) repeat protein